jgi:hypothetical protein
LRKIMSIGHAFIMVLLCAIALILLGLSCDIERASKRIASPLWEISRHQQCPKRPAWCTDD